MGFRVELATSAKFDLRQFLYGRKPHQYRVLFTNNGACNRNSEFGNLLADSAPYPGVQ